MNKINYKFLYISCRLMIAAAAIACFTASAAQAAPFTLQIKVPVGNTGNSLTIDNQRLNGKPNAKLLITQLYVPADAIYNPHPVGVRYDLVKGMWQITNEDGLPMPIGASFFVIVPPAAKRVVASALNSYFDRTYFPIQKKNDAALLLASHIRNPFPKVGEVDYNGFFGLYFIPASSPKPVGSNWSIYDEDFSPPIATAFNVWDATKDGGKTPQSFIFTAPVAAQIFSPITNALTDGKPDAVLTVSHVYTPAHPSVFNHPVGVDYVSGKWRIFTEDQTNFTAAVDFVVNVQPKVTAP